MKQQREPSSVCTGQTVLEWTGLSIHFYIHTCMLAFQSFWCSFPVSGYLSVHPEEWWTGGCHDGLITSGLCFAFSFWHTKHSTTTTTCCCHYLPFLASPAPFLHQSQALSSQMLEHNFIIDEITVVISVIIQPQVHVHVTYAIDACTVCCTYAI